MLPNFLSIMEEGIYDRNLSGREVHDELDQRKYLYETVKRENSNSRSILKFITVINTVKQAGCK